MGEKSDRDTRENIRLATIDLIERAGVDKVTTRAIAAAAGVNIAAINYYFRSKDILMSEALELSWSNMESDIQGCLSGDSWDCKKGLRELALYLLEGGFRFPNITRAHLLDLGTNTESGIAPKISRFRDVIAVTSQKVASALGITADGHLLLRTGAFFAGLLYPVFLPASFPSLEEPKTLHLYADLLVEDYLQAVERAAEKR